MISGRSFAAALALALALALAAGPSGAAGPAIAEFAADADFSFPSLSPDGTKLAYVTRVGDSRGLIMLDLAKRQRVGLMSAIVDSFEIDWCNFKTDDRLLCGLKGTTYERGMPYAISRLVSVDVTGKEKPRLLVQNGKRGASQFQDRIMDWQIDDPRRVLIQLSDERGPFPSVHALDVYTGILSPIQHTRVSILGWKTDRKGAVRFGYGYDDRRSIYITRDTADGDWRTLGKWELGESDFDVIGFGPTPGTLLVSAPHNGRDAIFEMDLSEKNDRHLLFAHPEVDVGGAMYWPSDRRIIGFRYETDRSQRYLFDEDAKAIYAKIDSLLPGAENYVVDASRDGMKLLIGSYTDVRPPEFHLLDLGSRRLQLVGSSNPALAKATHAPMKPIDIPGPGGIRLPGYLTIPAGAEGKNLPMVVYPHGGPYARDTWGFDSMVQFMASRGYAVLQVNFRGSVGYGTDWYEAGLRNWGTVMVDDITAATKWAIAQGIADPARTCIVGWSYGGYAALMSAVREPELYRCVASIAGVSDLRELKEESLRFYGGRFRGDYSIGTDGDELKAGSPLRSPEKIRAPVLLVHGDADIQVMVDHSKRMARALSGADKKHELVIIKDGNHSLSRYEWREKLLGKLEGFLAASL